VRQLGPRYGIALHCPGTRLANTILTGTVLAYGLVAHFTGCAMRWTIAAVANSAGRVVPFTDGVPGDVAGPGV
jgi:hypothetical protein